MRPFVYEQIRRPDDSFAPGSESASYLAGGTTLVDLMRLDVVQPKRIVDINTLDQTDAGQINVSDKGLYLGALTRMADAADHPEIRAQYPVIAESLMLAASQQIRNMASLGGNVLQRTRCSYFRDTAYAACNKRRPGSGCSALTGFNRSHAVLGTSDDCIATYPGDFAQALIALEATVATAGPEGRRTFPFAALHQKPGRTPDRETTLRPDELITGFSVPAGAWTKRSVYLKIRDRDSYEFALASAAVALDMEGDTVSNARIAIGGVATVPWRAVEAESLLRGKSLDDAILQSAANAAFSEAKGSGHNNFKIALGKRTVIRALRQAAAMEI